jgi:hypothetical protein
MHSGHRVMRRPSVLADDTGKDLAQDEALESLNELLASVEAELEAQVVAPDLPLVFVLGPPRSGSTLVSQILAASGGYGFISNFAARFWRAPALGVRLERTLRPWEDVGQTNFRSTRGRTAQWNEPNEFGYFWSRWFDCGQNTHKLGAAELALLDLPALRRALGAIEREWCRPLMFKNNTWFTFQADWLAHSFPRSVFVACERDLSFVAQSLLLSRLDKYGDARRWWSVRPPSYDAIKDLPPIEQVARQAVGIDVEMRRATAAIAPERVVWASYGRVCADPRGLLSDVVEHCRQQGARIDPQLAAVPERFLSEDRTKLPPDELRALAAAVDAARAALH